MSDKSSGKRSGREQTTSELRNKSILILGAGRVAAPCVRDLSGLGVNLTVVGNDVGETPDRWAYFLSNTLINDRIRFQHWGGELDDVFADWVHTHDLVISLLPPSHHVGVAQKCIVKQTDLLTTSYVSEEMLSLDEDAKARGVLLLNECGLDPGLDHMSIIRARDRFADQEYNITSLSSYCGGLPAPDFKESPWNYKFSWSPAGVIRAMNRDATYLRDDQVYVVAASDLADHAIAFSEPPYGALEAYPNGNSLPYKEKYGLNAVQSLLRGTIRYSGWLAIFQGLREVGLLSERNISDTDWFALITTLLNGEHTGINVKLREALHQIGTASLQSPTGIADDSCMARLAAAMSEQLSFTSGERDLVFMRHTYGLRTSIPEIDSTPKKGPEQLQEQLVVTGDPLGQLGAESAMAKTVGLTASKSAHWILKHRLSAPTHQQLVGVHIPTHIDIASFVLDGMAATGISFTHV